MEARVSDICPQDHRSIKGLFHTSNDMISTVKLDVHSHCDIGEYGLDLMWRLLSVFFLVPKGRLNHADCLQPTGLVGN